MLGVATVFIDSLFPLRDTIHRYTSSECFEITRHNLEWCKITNTYRIIRNQISKTEKSKVYNFVCLLKERFSCVGYFHNSTSSATLVGSLKTIIIHESKSSLSSVEYSNAIATMAHHIHPKLKSRWLNCHPRKRQLRVKGQTIVLASRNYNGKRKTKTIYLYIIVTFFAMRIAPKRETIITTLLDIILQNCPLKMKHHDTVVVIAVLAAVRYFPFVFVDRHRNTGDVHCRLLFRFLGRKSSVVVADGPDGGAVARQRHLSWLKRWCERFLTTWGGVPVGGVHTGHLQTGHLQTCHFSLEAPPISTSSSRLNTKKTTKKT